MKIIAVAINKGGTGKTTVARSLGTAGAAAGLNVLVLDMDTQQNATNWGRRRQEPLPLVRFVTENDLEGELERARAAGCDLVLIDTPPARSTEAAAAVEAADLVLIPCTPALEALETLPRVARLARTTGKPAVAVLNYATPNSQAQEETARTVFEGVSLPMAPVVLHRFKIHEEANETGQTAQELDPDSKAAAEVNALWAWVCAQLQLSTNAKGQRKAS